MGFHGTIYLFNQTLQYISRPYFGKGSGAILQHVLYNLGPTHSSGKLSN